jgi:hypothetical protein
MLSVPGCLAIGYQLLTEVISIQMKIDKKYFEGIFKNKIYVK